MASTAPATQQAAVLENPGPDAHISLRQDVPVDTPGPGEVLVKLSHTGICGSEVRALHGWGSYNRIIGHEGVGTVISHGKDVDASILGKRVGVKWLSGSCNECASCKSGFRHNCPRQVNTGRSCPGTLQQYVVADPRYVTEIPAGVAAEVAAPLLCAGLTMMGAVAAVKDGMTKGDWVVILGSGGGLGHIGVQIASRMRDFRVIGVDAGEDKRELTLESGAEAFIDYREEDVAAKVVSLTGEGAHAVLVVPGTKDAFAIAPSLARNRATIACVGLPADDLDIPISVMTCVRKALTIKGVMVGSEEDMVELLHQADKGVITPRVKVVGLDRAGETVSKLADAGVVGRVVVALP
ncbi:chaperonin 10-like protein [Plectosphaerella plurivora]|uniref:Chaperonin 10-like protein n=1 Tax=Plectosphaerella plurivora TaxID=936078 RepID=A0A9P8V7A6_9PEZI|nr:chaperonin 10-like protein [Plectosphaerella plurivora]